MSEIEIGEYVRTNKDNIGKVIRIFDGHCTAKYHIEFQGNVKVKRQYLSTKTIVKHSKNIIDLTTRDDYVNGKKVIDILTNKINGTKLIIAGDLDYKCKTAQEYIETEGISILGNDDIKSIVTKEQFKNIEYKVGE